MTRNSITDNAATFNILDHLDSPNLNIIYEKSNEIEWVCECPVCHDDNLKIARTGSREGAYQCWSNHCDIDQIRHAIAPLKELKNTNNFSGSRNKKLGSLRSTTPKKIEGRIELAKLPDDVVDVPKVERCGSELKTIYIYSEDLRVLRIEKEDPTVTKGRIKTFYPQHFNHEKNEFVAGKGDRLWLLYREEEATKYGKNKWVISPEGEKSVEAGRSLNLVSITPQGSDYREETLEPALVRLQKAGVAGIVILPDNDTPGKQKADKLEAVCNQVGMSCIRIDPLALYPTMPEAGDIADWIELESNMRSPEFIAKLEAELHRAVNLKNKEIEEKKEQQSKDELAKILCRRVQEIFTRNLSPANKKADLIQLAKDLGVPLKQVEDISELLEKEEEKDQSRTDSITEVNDLIKATESSLDLHAILPELYAYPIYKLAKRLNLRPETYLTALIVTVSTLLKVGTVVILNREWGFKVSPNLYGGVVAESSQKKSPILVAIIFNALGVLQDKAKEEFKKEMIEYEQRLEDYKSVKKEERKELFPDGIPKKPRQKLYHFDKTSGEGLINQAEAHPKQGLLYVADELAAVFKSQNQYRSGRGSDEEDLLSFYDGRGATVLRSDGVRANLSGLNLGIFGGIQPGILRMLMQDLSDANGKWARFLFVLQPVAVSQMREDSGKFDVNDLIAGLYTKIDALPPTTYRLDREAFKCFCEIYNELENRRKDDPSQAMRAYWGKSEGRIGKLAVNLHVIHELAADRQPSEYIPRQRIEEAIILTHFYADQIKALHIEFASSTDLAPHLVKIIKTSEAKGWIKVRDVQQKFDSKSRPKPKADEIRSWFEELEAMGRGTIQGSGKAIEFCVQKVSPSSPTPQNSSDVDTASVSFGERVSPNAPQRSPNISSDVPDSPNIDSDLEQPQADSDQNGEIWGAFGERVSPSETQTSKGTQPFGEFGEFGEHKKTENLEVETDDETWSDPSEDDPLNGGSGQPVEPSPRTDDDGGCAAEPTPELGSSEVSQNNTNNDGIEWLDPALPNYQEQCHAIAATPIIALDVETYERDKPKKNATPKALHPWQSGLRLVQLCIGERTFIVDFGDRNSDFEAALTRHQPTIDLLRQIIQNPDQKIVGQNIHFDLRILATKLGIRNAKNIACTRIGAQVYYGDYGSPEGQTAKGKHEPILTGGYSLANLAEKFLGIALDKTEQKSDFGADLTTEQISYAAKDPQITLRVYEALETLYNDDSKPLFAPNLIDNWQLECDVIPCAIEIELAGMPLDIEAAQHQLNTIEAHKKKLLEEWSKLCPDLKYTQRDKLINHLNQEYQLGLEKLNKGALNKKSRENPLIQIKLKVQGLDAQANNLKGFLNSAVRDGRVHTTYKTLTGFGRFSSGGGTEDLPNLQSIKAKTNPILKEFNLPDVRAVIKPAPGRTMAVIDLAGAHGRIAASETQDDTAIAGNNDETVDNHSKVAVSIAKAQGLNWTWEQIAELRKQKTEDGTKAKLFRDTAKNTYYGWLNGAGWQRIQEQITANTGITPTEIECKAAIEGCKRLYPGVLNHRNRLMIRLRHQAILLDGRKIAVNKISDGFRICMPLIPNKFEPNRLEAPYTQSLACIWSRIEATAVKRALIQVMELRQQHPEWGLEVINYVHDEIDIEVTTEFASIAVPLVNNIIGDCFAALLNRVNDGRETNWEKLIVNSWADK